MKQAVDKNIAVALVATGHVPFAVLALAFVPMPAQDSWPYIIAGALLHTGYQLVLGKAYKLGDYSRVYPVARGSAPLFIAVASFLFLGAELSPAGWASILIISAGVIGVALCQTGTIGSPAGAALASALVTGLFIAAYSLVDGLGAIEAGTALGFYAWLSLFNAGFMMLIRSRDQRAMGRWFLPLKSPMFWFGGGASFTAFAIVIWAFTQAPIALVSALRETSVIFALLFAHFGLKEKISPPVVTAILCIMSGLMLSRLA